MTHYTVAISYVDGETLRCLTTPSAKEALGFLKHCDHEGSALHLWVADDVGQGHESYDGKGYEDATDIYEVLENAAAEVSSEV